MLSVHQRRTEQEWKLLQALAAQNPDLLRDCERDDEADGPVFRFLLQQTPAFVEDAGQLRIEDQHGVSLHFPRFFPAVPLEACLSRPVFHPNVHPETGFVCLWNRFSSGDTVVEAVGLLRQVITWRLLNEASDHVMQPKSLEWYKDPARSTPLPLLCPELRGPEGFELARTYARRPEGVGRRRLE
jgi:hypothetical protein